MAKVIDRSGVVTYLWKYKGPDDILKAFTLDDKKALDDYCKKYKIKPQRALSDNRPVTMYDYDNLKEKKIIFNMARNGWLKILLINNLQVLGHSLDEQHKIIRYLQKRGAIVICANNETEIRTNEDTISFSFQKKKAGLLD